LTIAVTFFAPLGKEEGSWTMKRALIRHKEKEEERQRDFIILIL
jgi:hypothetical protein